MVKCSYKNISRGRTPKVGIRELKNRLSFYLKRVMSGERIEVTH
jgi:hypothetical protein